MCFVLHVLTSSSKLCSSIVFTSNLSDGTNTALVYSPSKGVYPSFPLFWPLRVLINNGKKLLYLYKLDFNFRFSSHVFICFAYLSTVSDNPYKYLGTLGVLFKKWSHIYNNHLRRRTREHSL